MRVYIKKPKFSSVVCATIISILLSGCTHAENTGYVAVSDESADLKEIHVDENAPVIEFSPFVVDKYGQPEYYLFDDNPEHLNSNFLVDGESPSSIAHFEELTPGIYTVFSYHHRGYSVDLNADLYYDAAFSSNQYGEFEILSIGIDHDWDWNQAWSDFTNTPVIMPEYLRTFNCTCYGNCICAGGGDACSDKDCKAIIRDEYRYPKSFEFDGLNQISGVWPDEPIFLSEQISYIENNDINHFRYGGYNEPMWMMLKFKVNSGTINFNTLAYQDKSSMKANFPILKKGAYDNEPQYKGIAKNAPVVCAQFDYEINDDTKSGSIPITVKNSRVPNGFTIQNGIFATNVNTWREKLPIAAESDMMVLEYKDQTKLGLYGENVEERDDVWRFDPFHTKIYGGYDTIYSDKLNSFGVAVGSDFIPNASILDINYPQNAEISTDEFYTYNACNLGNFGVTTKYRINVKNNGSRNRNFVFNFKSIAGQVYRYKQIDLLGNVIQSDEGNYVMKIFDDDPKEDPLSTSEPKDRLLPDERGDTLSFEIEPDLECIIEVDITTLTGCVAPMHNTFLVE